MKTCISGYRGRFAPSPTGPLHFGSLVGALASYLDARKEQGVWLVRMEDIDPLRVIPDAANSILKSLEAHGLYWDEQVLYQSRRYDHYQRTLEAALPSGSIYRCPCSRKELQENSQHRTDCIENRVSPQQPHALRFAVTTETSYFEDLFRGAQHYSLNAADDFIVLRKEGFFAYQLAVVADDHEQNITHVVRGIDLIDSTPLQLKLYQCLNWQPPAFGHFPVVTDSSGEKLSKRRLSPRLDRKPVRQNLQNAAIALQLISAADSLPDNPQDILTYLLPKWTRKRYASITKLNEPDLAQGNITEVIS